MPTYEFRCPKGHEFEKFYRSIGTAPAEVHCPECGALAERLLSGGAGLVFKGSGFYITDYGKDGKKDQRKAPVKTDSGSSEKSESSSSTTTDSGGTTSSDSKSSSETKSSSESKSSGDSKSSSTDSKSAASPAPTPAAAPTSSKKKDTK